GRSRRGAKVQEREVSSSFACRGRGTCRRPNNGIDFRPADRIIYTPVYFDRQAFPSSACQGGTKMEPQLASPPPEQSPEGRDSVHQPVCPCCGGLCIELRGFWRCARCRYRICETCEGGVG